MPEVSTECLLQLLSTSLFETGTLTKLRAYQLASWPAIELQGLTCVCPTPSALELKVHAIISRSYMDARICIQGLKSLCFLASTVLTEPFQQVLHCISFWELSKFISLWTFWSVTSWEAYSMKGIFLKCLSPHVFILINLSSTFTEWCIPLLCLPALVLFLTQSHSIGEAFHWGLYWVSHY